MRRHPDAPLRVDTIPAGCISVKVWLDTDPTMRAVLVHIGEFEQELHLPIGVAQAVADAISRAVAIDRGG